MPYSCQLQLGTSGRSATPVGAGSTWRAIARAMSHTSRFTMVHTAMRPPCGNTSGGRSTIGTNGMRWRGSSGMDAGLLHGEQVGDLVRLHDEAEGGADAGERRFVQRRAVHRVDAVLSDDHGIVARARGGHR